MTLSKVKTMFCLKTVYFYARYSFTNLINVINYFYNR